MLILMVAQNKVGKSNSVPARVLSHAQRYSEPNAAGKDCAGWPKKALTQP